MGTRKPRLVPYWQPPEHPAADERRCLMATFIHEIRDAQDRLTAEQLAGRLLTRLDLRGWGPGASVRPVTARRGWCDAHGCQVPANGRCPGCAADAKAAPD